MSTPSKMLLIISCYQVVSTCNSVVLPKYVAYPNYIRSHSGENMSYLHIPLRGTLKKKKGLKITKRSEK